MLFLNKIKIRIMKAIMQAFSFFELFYDKLKTRRGFLIFKFFFLDLIVESDFKLITFNKSKSLFTIKRYNEHGLNH